MTPEEWRALQLSEARKLASADLERHAEVSLRHRCRCEQCFCCAAVAVLKERQSETAR